MQQTQAHHAQQFSQVQSPPTIQSPHSLPSIPQQLPKQRSSTSIPMPPPGLLAASPFDMDLSPSTPPHQPTSLPNIPSTIPKSPQPTQPGSFEQFNPPFIGSAGQEAIQPTNFGLPSVPKSLPSADSFKPPSDPDFPDPNKPNRPLFPFGNTNWDDPFMDPFADSIDDDIYDTPFSNPYNNPFDHM